MLTEIIDDCKKKIEEADIVLIGFGKEFNVSKADILGDMAVYNQMRTQLEEGPLEDLEKQWIEYTFIHEYLRCDVGKAIAERLDMYNRVADYLSKHKKDNYFIVTTCNDDIITKSKLDGERMVAPCGTLKYMKCDGGCFKHVYETEEVYDNIYSIIERYMSNTDLGVAWEAMWLELKDAMPQCPMCKRVMSVNMVKSNNYSEEGYRSAWDSYMSWLQRTLNKKLVMLELGEGFDTPTVIRWPFEKVAAINNKATLIRVNKNFWQLSKDIEAKAISVKMSGIEFLENMEV